MVPLICPTCQNVFASKASVPAPPPCYFAWGCFRYFSWEQEPRRPCGCLSRDDRRVACRAVARAQRSPPSPDGLRRGSLRYEMACPAGQTVKAGGEGGIRTPDRLAPMPHFECGAFDHSATSPGAITGRICPSVGPSSRRGWLARQAAGEEKSEGPARNEKEQPRWSI